MLSSYSHEHNRPDRREDTDEKQPLNNRIGPASSGFISTPNTVFPNDRDFRNTAIKAGEVVWKNGLVKKVGPADGVSGNAYSFLSLYRLTGECIYEDRVKAFASFLYHNATKVLTIGDERGVEQACSLFQGLAGTTCLWFDVISPATSRFPGYEL